VKRLKLEIARADEAAAIAAMRTASAVRLTTEYGAGVWSGKTSENGALFHMRNAAVYVARKRNLPIATLTLTVKKPWAIDRSYFSPVARPLYLINMAVGPAEQRRGIGRACIEEVRRIATNWPADAIFLDAFDARAGAGEFYRRCGFREVGRAEYKGTPLIYFEMLLDSGTHQNNTKTGSPSRGE
jgi:GNAT superfamily N-acetyltransferase